jgi:hypothetical protein
VGESPLYDPYDQYDERNNFLYFLLGVLSLSKSLSTHLISMEDRSSSLTQENTGQEIDDLRELLL